MASQFDTTLLFFYETILGRQADQAGFSYWSSYVGSDATKLGDVVATFLNSSEFDNQDEAAVTRLYAAVFGRLPDKDGYEYWVTNLQSDTLTLQEVADVFVTSPEFESRFGSNPTTSELVTNMYRNTFGRDPDAGGQAYWENLVDTDVLSVRDLLLNFTQSAEGIERMQTRVDTVFLHHKLLDRMPTSLEFVTTPSSVTTLVNGLLAESDYVGPNPDQPTSALTIATDDAGLLTVSGSLAGSLVLNQTTLAFTEAGFDITPSGFDWTTVTTINLTGVTGNTVTLVTGDTAVTVTAGSELIAFTAGSGDDTLVLSESISPTSNAFQLGEGTDTIQLASSLNQSFLTGFTGFTNVVGSAGNDTLTFSEAQIDALTIDGGAGVNIINLSDAGTYDLAALTGITNVETFAGTSSGSYELLGTTGDDTFIGGAGADRFLGLAGADQITVGGGADVIAYSALTESQITATDTIFRGDVITGFEFGTDFIEMPTRPAGILTTDVTIPLGFYTNLSTVLAASADLDTALAGADDDVALVTITAGGAAGDYLVVQGAAATTGFDPAADFIIRLDDHQNLTDFLATTPAPGISDLFL